APYTDRRHFSGTGAASFAGYFNHLSFQVGGRATESTVVHSEVPQPTLDKTEDVFANVDLAVNSGFGFFATAGASKVRQSQEGVPIDQRSFVARYNRTDEAVSGGFRYDLGGWVFAPGVQYTTSRVVLNPDECDTTSLEYLLAGRFHRARYT